MSMRDVGIMDGDLLAVKQAKEAENSKLLWPGLATKSRSSAFTEPKM